MESKKKYAKHQSGAVSKVSLPFYEPPPRKTSAEIINEARLAIQAVDSHVADNSYAAAAVKPLKTQRPFTPREKERIFFGKKAKANRPPSSFSLRYLQTENEFNIPQTTPEDNAEVIPNNVSNLKENKTYQSHPQSFETRRRSNSVSEINDNKIFNLGVKELNVQKIKLPSLDALKPLQKKKLFKNTFSLDNLPEESEIPSKSHLETRNAFSSPQERTDFNENTRNDYPFGRPSKQQNLSQCLLLGPQNLNKIFENKQIVNNSETLFIKTGYFNKLLNANKNSEPKISALDDIRDLKEKSVDDVTELLIAESVKNNNDSVVIELLDVLYDCMRRENMLNNKVSSKMKIHILKCLYKFVESQNEKLLLNIARIILALKVTGNNLSGVCKLIFKVSKNDKNDFLFFQKNILELFVDAIGRSSPLDDSEACVYGYGSIKFLTMNPKLLQKILSLGVLPLMVLHIKIVNNARTEKSHIPEQTNHALFQLTGALRNLAGDECMHETFATSRAVTQLCQTMNLFASDLDTISNISRIFSTISANDVCCDEIAEHPDIFKVFVRLFEKYPGNEEIIVRLAYTMGNIVARSDSSREKLYNEAGSIVCLIKLWKIYLDRTLKYCSHKLDNEEGENGNIEDVMIKIIRIVANLAINPDIGKLLNENYGKQLITEFLKVLISNPFKKNDELVLSILSTLNNLSFYYTAELDQDIFHIKQIDIMEAISEYITSFNKECVIETMRILGNLSRSKITRNYIVKNQIFNTLLYILEKDDMNLLRTTVGVFVNLMADGQNRVMLRNCGGMSKLICAMSKYGQYDWSLSMLICQVIWNFSIDSINLYELLSDNEIEQLMSVLVNYLDEERLFGITDNSDNSDILMSEEYLIWEEFANVATNLLEKIEQFLDTIDDYQANCAINDQRPKTRDSSTNISFSAW